MSDSVFLILALLFSFTYLDLYTSVVWPSTEFLISVSPLTVQLGVTEMSLADQDSASHIRLALRGRGDGLSTALALLSEDGLERTSWTLSLACARESLRGIIR